MAGEVTRWIRSVLCDGMHGPMRCSAGAIPASSAAAHGLARVAYARREEHSLLLERATRAVGRLLSMSATARYCGRCSTFLVRTALSCNSATGESVWVRPVAVRWPPGAIGRAAEVDDGSLAVGICAASSWPAAASFCGSAQRLWGRRAQVHQDQRRDAEKPCVWNPFRCRPGSAGQCTTSIPADSTPADATGCYTCADSDIATCGCARAGDAGGAAGRLRAKVHQSERRDAKEPCAPREQGRGSPC